MIQYNTSLFYMDVLNGCQRLDAVVVVSSRVVKIDGALLWLFIVAAAAFRKLDPWQCCVFTGYFSVRIDVGLQEVSSSRYFGISGPNPVFPHFWISAGNFLEDLHCVLSCSPQPLSARPAVHLQVVTHCGGQFISVVKIFRDAGPLSLCCSVVGKVIMSNYSRFSC